MNSVYKGKTETKEVSVLRSYTTELVVSLRRAVLVVVVCVWWKHTGGEGLGFRASSPSPYSNSVLYMSPTSSTDRVFL